MKKIICTLGVIFLLSVITYADVERYTIQGKITDQVTGTPLGGSNIFIVELRRGTASNRSGEFSIEKIPEGTYTLRVQYVGYATYERTVNVPDDVFDVIDIVLESTPIKVDEVIVTASPVGSPLGYQAAQPFTLEELQKRSATSFGEMLNWEPGVAMRSFGSAPARPIIRGFDGDRILILENGERTGDISEITADNVITVEPLSANRVEVVRGPASLLYGSSALGGVVNIFTEDIPHIWSRGLSGTLALSGASMNRSGTGFGRFTYGGSGWAATGRLSIRDAGNIRTPEGELPDTYITNITGNLGAAFRNENLSGGFSIGAFDMTYGIPEKIDDPDESVEIRLNRYNLQGNANWNRKGFFDNIELRFNSSRYSHKEIEIELETDGSVDEDIELDITQYSVSSTLTMRHRGAGIIERGALGVYGYLRYVTVGGDEALTPDTRSNFLALFLFEEVHVSDLVHVQLGSRVELQDIDIRENELFAGLNERRTTTTFSGAFGINFRFSGSFEAGSQFARSHRAPLVDELYSDGAHLATGAYEIGDPDLKNEIGHGVDIFVRYKSDLLRAEIAGFYNNIDNYILLQATGNIHPGTGLPVFMYEADDAVLMGGEFSLEALLTSDIRVRSSIDYVRGSRIYGESRDLPLPFIPPFRSSLDIHYEKPTWWFGFITRYAAAQKRVAPGEETTDGYILFGLEGGYKFDASGRHTLSIRIDNLFDTKYRDHLSRIEDRNFPMPGRDVNVTYRWTF
jgi:iron complex outermembrane recepter protein